MPDYHVQWEVHLDADNPEDAARRAREMQLDVDTFCTVFTVTNTEDGGTQHEVDLYQIDYVEEEPPPGQRSYASILY
jgi:hypothetical protein